MAPKIANAMMGDFLTVQCATRNTKNRIVPAIKVVGQDSIMEWSRNNHTMLMKAKTSMFPIFLRVGPGLGRGIFGSTSVAAGPRKPARKTPKGRLNTAVNAPPIK